MASLRPAPTPRHVRDVKSLSRKHLDLVPLREVERLVCENTPESRAELRRRHNMHALRGDWAGSEECHVANAGDWLCVWAVSGDLAIFERTGTHDEIFG